MAKFADRLRTLRTTKQLSQQDLATQLGCVSKSSINMYERGEREPGLDTLEAIADYFNVDLDYLIGKSEFPSRYGNLIKNIDSYSADNDRLLTVGERIKHRRKEVGMSAEQVAEKLGISPSTVYRYENGEIEQMGIDKLIPIADALQTTPAYLMGWNNDFSEPAGNEIYRKDNHCNAFNEIRIGFPPLFPNNPDAEKTVAEFQALGYEVDNSIDSEGNIKVADKRTSESYLLSALDFKKGNLPPQYRAIKIAQKCQQEKDYLYRLYELASERDQRLVDQILSAYEDDLNCR